MTLRHLCLGAMCAAALTACGTPGSATSASSTFTSQPTTTQSVPKQAAPLTDADRALATRLAHDEQRTVTGTFIGATAFATTGTPSDPGGPCDNGKRYINIRLVWKADANFVHGGVVGGGPDGPRKALVMTVEPGTGRVCETGAAYRNVGAKPGEVLLYGTWPDPADG